MSGYFLNGKNVTITIGGEAVAGAQNLSLTRTRNLHKIRACLQNGSKGIADFGRECTVRLENIIFADTSDNLFGNMEEAQEIDITDGTFTIRCFLCLWTKREFEIENGEVRENWEFICEDWEEGEV